MNLVNETAPSLLATLPRLRRACAVLAVATVLAPRLASGSNTNPSLAGGPRHPMPVRVPGALAPAVPPPGAHLTYFGGPIVSNVQLVQVLWGASPYQPFITSGASPSMSTFYGGVFSSSYVDWLAEYDTNVTPSGGGHGTNQSLGRGSFLGQLTIAPSSANDGPIVDDVNIQAELQAQLAAGSLPAPTFDGAGHTNTLYVVHFPRGKKITQGGTSSCVAGGFCAYHGTSARAGGDLLYAVLPDMSVGSGCDSGCGSGTAFANQTSVASHEIVEAVTNPEVGVATVLGPPLSWYDNTNGEIGDICNGLQGDVTGADGVVYTVQQEWSNTAGACVVTRATPSDFAVTIAPATAEMAPGSSASFAISTTAIGAAQAVNLSVSVLPAGLTAQLTPLSVTAGSGATLTVTDAGLATPQALQLTITGTSATGAHAAAATLVVAPRPAIAPAGRALPPRGSQLFTVSGGSGTGNTWSLATNASGGRIDAASGAYVAGAIGGVADVVRVADSLGVAATASVTVTPGVSIAPASATVLPRGTVTFTAAGGSATGYVWSLATNTSGGSIDATSGVYVAGTAGGFDVVLVMDSLGNTTTRSVSVTAAPLAIVPAGVKVPPRGTKAFIAAGGTGAGLSWSLAANTSGGMISAAGVYTAGATGQVTDVVQVVDSAGNAAVSDVAVGVGASISPATATVTPQGRTTFAATGGSETGWTWSLASNASGGTIDPLTGAYAAGAQGGVSDVVETVDSLGNSATAQVTVSAANASASTPPSSPPSGGGGGGGGCSAGSGGELSLLLLATPLARRRRSGRDLAGSQRASSTATYPRQQ